MRHTIVTMTRGDGHKIAEWLDYHVRLGFDDFQVVLDGDVDRTEELLRSLDVPAEVTVHPRAEVGDYYDGLSPEERGERVLEWRQRYAAERASGDMRGTDALAWRQHQHFGPILAPYAAGERGKGWLGLIDVDEFVVLTQHQTIGELTAEQTLPRVRFLNFNVDTTGYDPQPSRPRAALGPLVARGPPAATRTRAGRSGSSHWCAIGAPSSTPPCTRSTAASTPCSTRTWRGCTTSRCRSSRALDIPFTVDDPIRAPTPR